MRFWLYLFISLTLVTATGCGEKPQQAAIASAHPMATQAGFEILNQGGNAFDAAVAVSAALAVVEPASSGLGGGGFWLLEDAKTGQKVMLDGRETAPLKAHRDMYLNADGDVNRDLSLNGPLAAGIPGLPAGLVTLSEQFGQLPLAVTLKPAITFARQGFAVTPRYQRMLEFRGDQLNAEAKSVLMPNGVIPETGTLIFQPDLATTLERIASQGRDGFYQGETAKRMLNAVQQAGGIWQAEDLAAYDVKLRTPLTGEFAGYQITTAALPSGGGILLINMLNQLASLNYLDADPALRLHYLAEVMRRAYHERSEHLGDSDFVDIPTHLTDKDFAAELAAGIDNNKASVSEASDDAFQGKGRDTTHFSIIDQYGNKVAATLSINYPFGSGFMVPGTGILLNDEMDDFSAKAGSPNAYGLVSESANSIEPGKRPLSSMTPTFVENDEKLLIIGTPGGSRIITMVLQGVLHFVDGQDATEIVAAPRLHHQYLPDHISLETPGFDDQLIESLENRGHEINQLDRQFGNMQLIILNKQTGKLQAASDPRGEGSAVVRIVTAD
ncbi:MAG TPA: gamma-glutamyltransferase [Methylophaga sp.]|nr:gamma-glutamyltransferase [Methylophaga sp.]